MHDDEGNDQTPPAEDRHRPDPRSLGGEGERLDRLVMSRIRGWISLREVLYFGTLGFLYGRGQPPAGKRGTEDPDR